MVLDERTRHAYSMTKLGIAQLNPGRQLSVRSSKDGVWTQDVGWTRSREVALAAGINSGETGKPSSNRSGEVGLAAGDRLGVSLT